MSSTSAQHQGSAAAWLHWTVRPEFWGSLLAHATLLAWIGWPTLRPAAPMPAPLDVFVVDQANSETVGEEVVAGDAGTAPVASQVEPAPRPATAARPAPLRRADRPITAEPSLPAAPDEAGDSADAGLPASAASLPVVPQVMQLDVPTAAVPPASVVGDDPTTSIPLRFAEHLRRHQFYPRAARRARLEGMLRLSVRIDGEGRVRQVAIVESSGHAVLDHAALSLVARAEPFPSPRALAGLDQVELELPLDYRLDTALHVGSAR